MGQLKKGDKFHKFSASEWNDIRARSDRSSSKDFAQLVGEESNEALDGIVQVVNNTGSPVEPGDVLGLAAPAITPASDGDNFRNTLNFTGVIPTDGSTPEGSSEASTNYTGRFGVALNGGAVDGLIPAAIFGPVWAKISMTSATDKFADIYPGSKAKLKSGSSGAAQILYFHPAGSSFPQDTYAYVRIGNTSAGGSVRCARFTTEVSDDLTYGTVKVWDYDEEATDVYPEGDFVETEEEVHPVFCFLRPAGETIAERTRCHIVKIGDIEVAIVVACEPDPEETPP